MICTDSSDERLLLRLPRFDCVDPASQLVIILRQDVNLRLFLFLQNKPSFFTFSKICYTNVRSYFSTRKHVAV